MTTDRSLQWSDRWLKQYDGGEVDPVCEPASPLAFHEGEATAVVSVWTPEQFKRILSALCVGAEIIYPDTRNQVIWDLVKGVTCGMDLCDQVAQSIYDCQNVRDALIWVLVGLGLLDGDGNPVAPILGGSVTGGGTGCTDADKYGKALAIVDALNRLSVDVLETLAAAADIVETAADLLLIIPILGPLIAASLNIATFLFTYGLDAYNAAYSEAIQADIACDLLCRFNDCDLTLQAIMESYLADLAGYTPPGAFASVTDVAEWLVTLSLGTDRAIVEAVQYVILSMWAAGSTVKQAKPNFLTLAAVASDPVDPSGTCDTCEDCVGFGGTFGNDSLVTVLTDEYGYTGTYNAAQHRWEAVWNHVYASGKYIEITIPNNSYNIALSKIRIAYDVQNSRGGLGVYAVYLWDNELEEAFYTFVNNGAYPPNGVGVIEMDVASQGKAVDPSAPLKITLACRSFYDDSNAHAYITAVELCGTVDTWP